MLDVENTGIMTSFHNILSFNEHMSMGMLCVEWNELSKQVSISTTQGKRLTKSADGDNKLIVLTYEAYVAILGAFEMLLGCSAIEWYDLENKRSYAGFPINVTKAQNCHVRSRYNNLRKGE